MRDINILLDNFARAKSKILTHIENNREVFDEHQSLVLAVIDAENALKDTIADAFNTGEYDTVDELDGSAEKKPIPVGKEVKIAEASGFKVSIIPQEQKVFDEEALGKILNEEQLKQVVQVFKRPVRISIKEL